MLKDYIGIGCDGTSGRNGREIDSFMEELSWMKSGH